MIYWRKVNIFTFLILTVIIISFQNCAKKLETSGGQITGASQKEFGPFQIKLGKATFNHDSLLIDHSGGYKNPVVIVGPPTTVGGQQGVIRLSNIGSDSFEIYFREWLYLDGVHYYEDASYMVLEEGFHTMPDGSVWEVGTFNIKADPFRVSIDAAGLVTLDWWNIKFKNPTGNVPQLFVTAQTNNGLDPMTLRVKQLTKDGFSIAISEEEQRYIDGFGDHLEENIGYLAIHKKNVTGIHNIDNQNLNFTFSEVQADHNPIGIAPGFAVYCEEEISADPELSHNLENIQIMRINGYLFAQAISTYGGNNMTLRIIPSTPAGP